MSSKPWFAWFPGDYRSKTAHLTFEQDGAYRRLLDAYYERRGPLPCDSMALYRLTSAQSQPEREAVDFVVNQFFTNGDGTLKHGRCDEQIAKESALHNKWVEAGRKGGLSRAQGCLEGSLKGGSTIPSPSPHLSPDLNPSPQKTKTTARAAPFVLPEWVPKPQWEAWLEARTKARKPATEWAKKLAVRRLEEHRDNGHSPALVLAESAFNNWSGLYEPRGRK